MKKTEKAIIMWRKCKDVFLNLNLFPSVTPSTDEHQLRTQRISTRLFILVLILSITILLLYSSLANVTKTITVPTPSPAQYSQLYSKYSPTLACPCTHISINYGLFLDINYTLHQVCRSFFVTDEWVSYITIPRVVFYVSGDFRVTAPFQFAALRAFCELINSMMSNSLSQFNSNQYITALVTPSQSFHSETQLFIDRFKLSTTNTFLLSLNMIRKTVQGNALLAGRQTNYKLHSRDADSFVRTESRYYSNCNCALSGTCIDNSSLFNGPSNTRVFNVTGFYAGCYTVEALLRSTLECFYNQSCIDGLQLNLFPLVLKYVPALNSSFTTQYFENSTIEHLLTNLMIEEWNATQLYDRYYVECQPIRCTYTIKTRNDVIYTITSMIGIIGGLSKVAKLLVLAFVKIMVYCLRKWRNRVAAQISIVQARCVFAEANDVCWQQLMCK